MPCKHVPLYTYVYILHQVPIPRVFRCTCHLSAAPLDRLIDLYIFIYLFACNVIRSYTVKPENSIAVTTSRIHKAVLPSHSLIQQPHLTPLASKRYLSFIVLGTKQFFSGFFFTLDLGFLFTVFTRYWEVLTGTQATCLFTLSAHIIPLLLL